VQMDSLEVLLRGQGDDDIARNEFEDELWSVFFNGFLAGQDCQSRLILTSQDLPTQFGSRYKNFWAEEPLKGLNEAEQFELFQKLFQRKKKEIEPESEAAGYLKRMGNAYEGHPLVIEVIAGEILAFNGNVMVYWQRYRQEFEAIEPVIGHQKPQLKVKDRVRKSLKRLAHDVPNAYTLLCRSSVYRRLAPESFWLAMLGNLTEEEKAFALGILQLRYLAFDEGITSTGQFLLRQHNLIRSVAYELLRKTAKHSSEWQDAHHTAADMWCTAYEPEPDIPNLEKVRGYLEAFYHLVQVENWKGASEILFIRRDTFSNKDLGEQLFTWAYYREQIDLYSQLRGKLDQQCDAMCLVGLGNASNFLGHHRQAIEYSQQSLAIAREIGDRLLEGKALGNLGNAYNFLGEYQQAIEYYQQYLAFAPEIGDRLLEGKTLGNLGIAYKNLGQYEQAIEYYQQYLKIAREEIKDGYAEGRALGSLGAAYLSLKNYEQAIEYYQQWLVLARDIGDRNGQGNALGGLGNVYGSSGQYQQAIEYHQQWLVIARERGDLYGEAAALCNFGESLIKLEQYSEAQGKLQEALEIVRRNGYRSIEAALLKNLAELHHKWAKLHHKLGNRELGIKFCNQALALATELGIPLAQECQELNEKLLNEQM
jgi:tetratricopeptide (TPR) repeat protein